MRYSEYLQTDHWKKTRQTKLREHKKCQICGSEKNIQIHHKQYRWVGREPNGDLLTLCASCHALWHAHFSKKAVFSKKRRLKITRLLKLGVDKRIAFILSKDENAETWGQLFPRIKSGEFKERLKSYLSS